MTSLAGSAASRRLVDFDQRDARGGGDAGEVHGIGTGIERDEERGIATRGIRQGEGADRGERGGERGRAGPVVVALQLRAAAEELEPGIREQAGDAEGGEPGADAAD